MIALEEINFYNIDKVKALFVKEEQKNFIVSNEESLAQAQEDPQCVPYAITFMEEPIGFLMYHKYDPDEKEPFLYRLMIEKSMQGKGFGRQALDAWLYKMRTEENAQRVWVGVNTENKQAENLYTSAGFVWDGRILGREKMFNLSFKDESFCVSLRQLGASQLFLCRETCQEEGSEGPLEVADLGLGFYVLCEDHHRACARLFRGDTKTEVVLKSLTAMEKRLLEQKFIWADRFEVTTLEELCSRIVGQAAYRRLWLRREERMENLLGRFSPEACEEKQALVPQLFLYGASEDGKLLYYEDSMGVSSFLDAGKLYDETTGTPR